MDARIDRQARGALHPPHGGPHDRRARSTARRNADRVGSRIDAGGDGDTCTVAVACAPPAVGEDR
jgi:hypothetical protein